MASNGSTIFTVGTLLSRAQESGMQVRALVQGEWLTGVPVASDSHGIILDGSEDGQYLIRLDAITAVHYMRHSPDDGMPEPRAEQERPTTRTGYAATTRPAVGPGQPGE